MNQTTVPNLIFDQTSNLSRTYGNDSQINIFNVTRPPYVRPFDETGIIVSATIIFTFLVCGLFGNIVTICVIVINPKLKNVFMHFILSLCISDLISAMISWLFLYRRTWGFDVWYPLPTIFCRFYWATDLMTNYVTALHIFSFATLRYVSIQFPIQFSKIKLLHARIWISIIWIVTFLIGFIPYFIFFNASPKERNSDEPDARWPACTIEREWYAHYVLYAKIAYSIFLYAPSIGTVLISVLIGVTVKRRTAKMETSKNGHKKRAKERQAVLQLTLIVVSFLVGYVPFTAYEFWSVIPRANTRYHINFDYWFGMSEYFLLRFSECLNPVFYNLGSAKMRQYTKVFLAKCCFSKSAASNNHSSIASSRSTRLQGV